MNLLKKKKIGKYYLIIIIKLRKNNNSSKHKTLTIINKLKLRVSYVLNVVKKGTLPEIALKFNKVN